MTNHKPISHLKPTCSPRGPAGGGQVNKPTAVFCRAVSPVGRPHHHEGALYHHTQLKSKASGDPDCGKAEEALESLCAREGA